MTFTPVFFLTEEPRVEEVPPMKKCATISVQTDPVRFATKALFTVGEKDSDSESIADDNESPREEGSRCSSPVMPRAPRSLPECVTILNSGVRLLKTSS